MLQAHLGNALPHQLGAEAEVVAVGPACLTMTGNALFRSCFHCEQRFFRNRSMDDDLEGRAREREAPSVERGSTFAQISNEPHHHHQQKSRNDIR